MPEVRGGFEVKGMDKIFRQLKSVKSETRAKVLRGAMRKAFQSVKKEARARVPVKTGELREGIQIGRATSKKEEFEAVGIVMVTTSTRKKQAMMAAAAFGEAQSTGVPPSRRWHFIELGTVRQAPQPFLRPALHNNQNNVTNDLAKSVNRRIKNALKKK